MMISTSRVHPSQSIPAMLLLAVVSAPTPVSAAEPAVNFSTHIAPIFQEKCQQCHRPGAMAPMPLVTYEQTRPWVRSIRQRVANREMPPWALNKQVGIREYKNDMSLSSQQIDTILKWIDAGAPQGDPRDLPASRQFPNPGEWQIGTPDLVVKASKEHVIEAEGYNWWVTMEMESGLTEDRWVKAVELKPGNPRVVHHIGLVVIPPKGAPVEALPPGAAPPEGVNITGAKSIQTFTPGKTPDIYRENTGFLLRKGSRIRFGMHYASVGEVVRDRSEVGFVFYPKGQEPKYEMKHTYFELPHDDFDIPPDSVAEHDVYFRLSKPTRLENWSPHLHERGKAMMLEAIHTDGKRQVLSYADRYDFGWQIIYDFDDAVAPLLPAGTMLHLVSTHDNRASNRKNPNPHKWVGYGQSSSDEMAGAFIRYIELSEDDFKRLQAERAERDRAERSGN